MTAAEAAGVSRTTASKWLHRYRDEGLPGLADRASRPRRLRARLAPAALRRIYRRRRLREPHRISWETGIARSTVYRVLARNGLSRLAVLGREPRPPVRRYEHAPCGDLLHLDTKRLGRIGPGGGKRCTAGRTRTTTAASAGRSYTEPSTTTRGSRTPRCRADETAASTASVALNALAFHAAYGITVPRVLTDNAFYYGSHAFLAELEAGQVSPRRTRPHRPQTNGKAEALVKTLVNGWAYARPYDDSAQRTAELERFLTRYNHFRPHGGVGALGTSASRRR